MRYYFAPMEGITSYLHRAIHRRFFPGVDRYYMPFVSPSQGHAFTKREKADLSPEHNAGVPAVPQLLTRRAEDFIWAAEELAHMGYREVNLNLGCPSGTVTAKGKGSGFLAFPEELERFLDEIYGANLPIDISLKTRLGVKDEGEFPALLELYNRYPVKELTIHPRVQKDLYRLPVRPAAFAKAAEHCKLPLCYNGDLCTVADCRNIGGQYPQVEALMLGRALVADPALVRKLRGGPPATAGELETFHNALYDAYTEAFGSRRNAMLRMKEIWYYHIHLFRDHDKHAKHIRKARETGDFEAWTASAYRELELLPGLPRGLDDGTPWN